jgi:hypothetical protein
MLLYDRVFSSTNAFMSLSLSSLILIILYSILESFPVLMLHAMESFHLCGSWEFFHVQCDRFRVSSKQSNFFFSSNRNKPNLNPFRLFFDFFRETKKIFLRFVSVCFSVSDRYRNNRNKQNFLETNRKNLQKTFSLRGSSKPVIFFFFFSVRTETNRNSILSYRGVLPFKNYLKSDTKSFL